MQIITTPLGEVQVEEQSIITFPQGLPGYAEARRFIILPYEQDSPFHFLQSIDEQSVTLIIANPFVFFPDYKISTQDLCELQLEDIEQAIVLVVVVAAKDPREITANLLAPIIINPESRLGKQVIMTGDKYTTKHKLLPE